MTVVAAFVRDVWLYRTVRQRNGLRHRQGIHIGPEGHWRFPILLSRFVQSVKPIALINDF